MALHAITIVYDPVTWYFVLSFFFVCFYYSCHSVRMPYWNKRLLTILTVLLSCLKYDSKRQPFMSQYLEDISRIPKSVSILTPCSCSESLLHWEHLIRLSTQLSSTSSSDNNNFLTIRWFAMSTASAFEKRLRNKDALLSLRAHFRPTSESGQSEKWTRGQLW